MSDYTKINIKELDDAAQSFGLGDNLEARFARKAMGLEKFGFSYQKMQPNFRQPFGHEHGEQEEAYLVLEGSGRIKIDDEIVDLRQWDAVRIPPGATRAFESGDTGLTILAMGAGPTGDTGEVKKNWWDD